MAVKVRVIRMLSILGYLGLKNDEQLDPQLPIPEDGVVAGELDEDQKNLLTSYMRKAEESEILNISHQFCGKAEERAELLKKKELAGELAELLKDIFWFEVKQSFDLHHKSVVGIGTGWVVWYRDKPEGECDCPLCSLMSKLGDAFKDTGIPS